MNRIALFPGSFDPFTIGHADIVERGLQVFDRIIVAVGFNEQKPGWMPVKERLESIRKLYAADSRVSVISYTGLTADLVRHTQACCLLRGVRSVKDYEYEQQMADINQKLCGVETVLLFTRPELASISSSIVRELAHFGRDVSPLVPAADKKRPAGHTCYK